MNSKLSDPSEYNNLEHAVDLYETCLKQSLIVTHQFKVKLFLICPVSGGTTNAVLKARTERHRQNGNLDEPKKHLT